MNFAQRRRRNLWSSLRYNGLLALIAGLLLACTVAPMLGGWWDTAIPAAIGSAIAALLLFAVAVSVPLEAVAYVALYLDRDPYGLPQPPRGFGRALYRESGRLDAIAREAGLAPLSEFESDDPLNTGEIPVWHAPEAALLTVEHLLARAVPPMHPHLEYLRASLQAAAAKGAKFYFLVLTWAGGTNARVEALRHGDTSVLRLLALSCLCLAGMPEAHAQLGVPWNRTPDVAVISAADDPRLPDVDEAVGFWNRALEELGSGFRLGTITRLAQPVPEEALKAFSHSTLSGMRPIVAPQALRGLPGDLTVLLGESAFVSFTGRVDPDGKSVIGIRGGWPVNLPNVARNLIAHEIGHALGFGHNSDPAMLMCGRPAPCRPDAFHAPEPRMFPLTDDEKRRLLRMYPADWKPATGARP